MKKVRNIQAQALATISAGCLACSVGCDDSAAKQTAEKYYQQQDEILQRQNSEWERQLEKAEEQDARYDAILGKWEEHDQRVEALLDRWDQVLSVLEERATN